jgi:hypothetical protein
MGTVTIGSLDSSSEESLDLQRGTSVYEAAQGRLESRFLLFKSAMYR